MCHPFTRTYSWVIPTKPEHAPKWLLLPQEMRVTGTPTRVHLEVSELHALWRDWVLCFSKWALETIAAWLVAYACSQGPSQSLWRYGSGICTFNSIHHHCATPQAIMMSHKVNWSSPTSQFTDGKTEAYDYKAIQPEYKFLPQSLCFFLLFPLPPPSLPLVSLYFKTVEFSLLLRTGQHRGSVHWAALLPT